MHVIDLFYITAKFLSWIRGFVCGFEKKKYVAPDFRSDFWNSVLSHHILLLYNIEKMVTFTQELKITHKFKVFTN